MAKSNKETFDNTYTGSQPPPLLPTLRNDPAQLPAAPQTLESYRELEDAESREKRIHKLFKALPSASDEAIVWNRSKSKKGQTKIKTPEEQAEDDRRERLRSIYNQELMNRVGGGKAKPVDYQEFVKVRTFLGIFSRWYS
jgi:solute carrier family 25 phosphate transporter 23/24/25/41